MGTDIRRVAWSTVITTILITNTAFALGSSEHSAISEAGLRLACQSLGLGSECDVNIEDKIPQVDLEALRILIRPADLGQFSYADFTAYVDFIDDPSKLLRPEPLRGWQEASARTETDLDLDFLIRLRGRSTARLHALHNNSSHFQDHLMFLLWDWHRQALEEARIAGAEAKKDKYSRSLYMALLKNAISSHYLQDFFAPGHIVAPREGYPDYAANTLHDRYNSKGMLFELSNDFRVGARVLETAILGGKHELAQVLELEEDSIARIYCGLLIANKTLLLRGDGDVLHPSGLGVDKMLTNISLLEQKGRREKEPGREFGCDTPNCQRESEEQRLALTILTALSTREVLEEYLNHLSGLPLVVGYGAAAGKSRGDISKCTSDESASCEDTRCRNFDNSSADRGVVDAYQWRRMRLVKDMLLGDHKIILPSAEIAAGRYLEEGPTRIRFGHMSFLEFGWEYFHFDDSVSGRLRVGAEWIPAWVPPGLVAGNGNKGEYVPKLYTVALGVGGGYRREKEDDAWEASLRFYFILPRLDMYFAGALRSSWFSGDNLDKPRFSPEIRWGKTYGFVSIYLGASYDYRGRDGELGKDLGLASGIQFAVPWWRAARWTTNRAARATRNASPD